MKDKDSTNTLERKIRRAVARGHSAGKLTRLRPTSLDSRKWENLMASDAQNAVDNVADAFEDARQLGQPVDLAAYLAKVPAEDRSALLRELVQLDLEYNLRAGKAATVESYLARFPEMEADRQVVLDLIALEYRVRFATTPSVSVHEYYQRFPSCREEQCFLLRRRPTPCRRSSVSPSAPTTEIRYCPTGSVLFRSLGIRVVVSLAPVPPANVGPKTTSDVDRTAALCVLAMGGWVEIVAQGESAKVSNASELPKESFELSAIELGRILVVDADFVKFARCKNVKRLAINHTPVRTASLENFRNYTNLTHLNLERVSLTDAALEYLKACTKLTFVNIGGTGMIGDAGLAHLASDGTCWF